MDPIYLKECYLTSIYHYNALEVWDEIKVCSELNFEEADENDKRAKLSFNGTVIGELTEEDSYIIVDVLKQNHTDVFIALVSYKSGDDGIDEDKRLRVVIKVK